MASTKRKKKYKTPPPPLTAQEKISRYMRGNKSRDTKPELLLRRALWQGGLRGYRVHRKQLPGKPDICYPGRRLAIFVHGCFWHRCPHCQLSLPKSNISFWTDKFTQNQARDVRNYNWYRSAGWQILVIWECQLKQNLEGCVFAIRALHAGAPESCLIAA